MPAGKAGLEAELGKITEQPGIVFRPLHEIVAEAREAEWLIDDVLEANVIAVLAGARGTLKSFIALHWVMSIACENQPCVILSGEGQGLDRRVSAWMNQHRETTELSTLPVMALERPLNLNSAAELEALQTAIAALPGKPRCLLVDTFSKFSAGIDENSNGEVAAYLSGLATLRDQFGCSILLVAHSGHGDAKRPRGANALMSNPDAEYMVERTGMNVTVSRDRFKDTPSLPPLAYEARVVDLGRLDRRGRPVTSLALLTTDAPDTRSMQQPRGKAQRELLTHLRAVRSDGAGIWTLTEMREIARKMGHNKGTARSAVEWLATSGFMTATIGGYRISDDAG